MADMPCNGVMLKMSKLDEIKKLDWYRERPEKIQQMICKYPFSAKVSLKDTKQTAFILSWFNDGTYKVVINQSIDGNFSRNPVHEKTSVYCVFGVEEDNMELLHVNDSNEVPDFIMHYLPE